MTVFKSLWLIFFALSLSALCCLAVQLLRLCAWLRGHPPYQNLGHQIGIFWGRAIFACTPGWTVNVYGRDNVPTSGAFVVASNHESVVDIFAMYVLGIQFRWLGKESMFQVPVLGAAMRHNGYIPIRRGDKDSHRKALAQSAAHIRAGTSMLFFPEGTRSSTGHIAPFKIGAFKLAKENHVPIVPVVLKGAGRLLRKKSLLPQTARLEIHVLPPMMCLEGETIDAFTERVRNAMVAVHEV